MAKIGRALSVCGTAGRRVHLASESGLLSCYNILEDVALGDNHSTRVALECVSAVGVEVVVDGVDEGVSADLGRAAGSVVDVVALEGDQVARAGKVQSP